MLIRPSTLHPVLHLRHDNHPVGVARHGRSGLAWGDEQPRAEVDALQIDQLSVQSQGIGTASMRAWIAAARSVRLSDPWLGGRARV
jgi:hypothetical protein